MSNGGAIPVRVAMFPLGTVLFPTQRLVLQVFEPRYQVLLERCLAADRRFGVVLITRGSEVGGGDQRASVGTTAVIEDLRPLAAGRWVLAVRGLHRLRVTAWLPDDPHPVAEVLTDPEATSAPQAPVPGARHALERATAAVRRTTALLSEHGGGAALPSVLALAEDPVIAGWQLCALAPLGPFDAQGVLERDELTERLSVLTDLMDEQAADIVAGLRLPPSR